MEDKKLNEKESLELITQMIQNSKKNLRLRNVNILLLWGYLAAITAIVVYVLVLVTDNQAWNWLWLATPAIGFPVMYWQWKTTENPVMTYTDKVMVAVWKNVGQYGISASVLASLYFDSLMLLLPIILLLCSVGVAITGSIIKDNWMYNSAGIGAAVSIVIFSHFSNNPPGVHIEYIGFAICVILMLIIPGHRLNKKSKTD